MPKYCIYIDEAGDPGVKPKETDQPDRTDWFTIAAVVSRADRDPQITDWIKDMKEAVRSVNGPALHYRNLSETNQARVCRMLGRKPVRAFVVASHKDSMRRHYNPNLGRANGQVFYNFCIRLLLERVTEWCYAQSREDETEDVSAAIQFSERGGHDYNELRKYLRRLEAQSLTGKLVLSKRGIAPGVIGDRDIHITPHADLGGLQLADVVASAFFNAANSLAAKHSCEPAMELRKIIACRPGTTVRADNGLLRLPFPHQGPIPMADRAIFESYGYEF